MRIRLSLLILLAASVAACDDGLGPQPWDATPDTVSLYSASRSELLGYPSAFDFVNLAVIRVESPGSAGSWDVVLAGSAGLQLVPAGAFEGQDSRAGIAVITGTTFEALTSAPTDTSQYSSQAVALQQGGVYVVRTRRAVCSFSTAVHFAKIKVVSIDAARGVASFAVVRNPDCNDRSFVPPKD